MAREERMCQAFEGESAYITARDKATRKRGYDAWGSGVKLSECPEQSHELKEYSDAFQWSLGWETADLGMEFW